MKNLNNSHENLNFCFSDKEFNFLNKIFFKKKNYFGRRSFYLELEHIKNFEKLHYDRGMQSCHVIHDIITE